MNGFKTFSEFVHAWIDGKYPVHQKDEQIEKLINRMRSLSFLISKPACII